jgi:Spy/CpxP family protein refolding chaperone
MLLALAVAALLAGPAAAQRPFPGPGGMGGMIGNSMLLNAEKVQKELKLTDDQIKKIASTRKEIDDKFKEEREKLRDIKDRREQAEKRAELNKKIGEETTKALSGVLKEDQTKRLDQLRLQLMGIGAFSDEKVQKELKVDDDQKADIKKITEDLGKDIQGLFTGGFDPAKMQENMKKMQEMNKEAAAKVVKVLNDTQKKTWKDMTGEPTTLTMQDLFTGIRPPMRDRPPQPEKDK